MTGIFTPAYPVSKRIGSDRLRDYEQVRSDPFREAEQRTAAAAVTWVLAYDARCQVSLLPLGGGPAGGSSLEALTTHPDAYLDLCW
jgi:hypothetical protein